MAEIHHFAYGWINPVLAYALSFIGSLLGLVLTARSRELAGFSRLRWLTFAAVALGGTGIWLMHFMAMLGFDVPESAVRYDPWITAGSAGLAIVIVALGLYLVGFGRLSVGKIVLGGTFTGIGVAATHYAGMAGMNVGGQISYDPVRVALSVVIAVVSAIVALWFAVAISSAGATVWAALLMGLAVCSMHYTGMSAMRVRVQPVDSVVPGVGPFVLLLPICVAACVVLSMLAYATVSFSVRRENLREDAQLTRSRAQFVAAAAGRFRPRRSPTYAGPVHSGPAQSGPVHSGQAQSGPARSGPAPSGPADSRTPVGAGTGPHRSTI